MSNQRREIECIARLQSLDSSVENILVFLLGEGLVSKEQIKTVKGSPDLAKDVQKLLAGLSQTGKLQLLEYEWHILPVERIRIHIVTDRNNQEFAYNF